MKKNITANRTQPGVGTVIILLYALYGAYISSLYILKGEKGGYRSDGFLIFVIVFLLFCLSNFSKLILRTTLKSMENYLIVLFFIYMMIRIFSVDSRSVVIPFIDIAKYFVIGFIAFSVFESSWPIISDLTTRSTSTKGIMALAILGTVCFIGCTSYLLTRFLGGSLLDVFSYFRAISNDYYQSFGDFITIAFCCLTALQTCYFNRNAYSDGKFGLFSLILLAQAALAVICLQAVNSNKSPLIIMLVLASAIYLNSPPKWLDGHYKTRFKVFILILILLLGGVFLYRFLTTIDVSQLRIFDYGKSSSILTNSSILVRWQQVKEGFIEQFLAEPILGDPSISNYMHSSLLSIQTHLGIIGSLLLWSFVFIKLRRIYRNSGNEGLKALALPILFVSVISSFFSWGPLWFLIGALYSYAPQTKRLPHRAYYDRLQNNHQKSTFVGRQIQA